MSKPPSGSSASAPGGRPRAQISYEGEDEFSAMSLDPSRKKVQQSQNKLAPIAPGAKQEVKVNELKSTNENKVGFFRKIFAK